MIPAALSDDALLEDIQAANRNDDQLRLWWLGQSGFLIQSRGRHVLVDPYLSDSLTQKYRGTSQPHLRMTQQPIAPDRLDMIDLVTSSHRHTDHLDAATLVPLLQANPDLKLVVPKAQIEFSAERLEGFRSRLLGLEVGETLRHAGIALHAIASAHDEVELDKAGQHLYLGYVIEIDGWTLYHSGDTMWHNQLVDQLAGFKIDIALLPINGQAPERHVSGNLWGAEAAELARQLGVQMVIPHHYAMFSFNSVTPDEFRQACYRLDQPHAVLQAGERWETVGLKSPGSKQPMAE